MPHSLYYTDYEISEADYRAHKPGFMAYSCNDLDDALGKARQIKEYGGVPWEIECEDGTILDRAQIARTLRERARELVGRPKVY